MNRGSHYLIALLVLGAITLSACTSSSDGNGNGNGGTTLTATYQFYLGATNQLYAVNPRVPADGVVEVKADGSSLNVTKSQFIRHATFSNDALNDIHYPWLVVLNATDGSLYKINALVSAGAPVATQLSSTTGILAICNQDFVADFTDSSKSVYLFYQLDSGSDCATGSISWKAIALGADNTTSLTSANKVIEGVRSSAGALTGFLVKKQSLLQLVNTNFASATTVDNASGPLPMPLAGSPRKLTPNANGVYLFTDDNKAGANLYGYSTEASALTHSGNSLHTFSNAWNDRASDENYFFIDDGSTIYRINRDGATTSTAHVTGITGGVKKIALTDSYIVYLDNNKGLYKVAKNAASAVDQSSLIAISSEAIDFYTGNAWIYWNSSSIVTSAGTAHFVKEDGSGEGAFTGNYVNSPTNMFGAYWGGLGYSTSRSDEVGLAKTEMHLVAASSDTKISFYKAAIDSSTISAAAWTIPATTNLETEFGGNDYEGDYSIVAILGASGEAYVINSATGVSTRVDDVNVASDNPYIILTP